MVTLSVKKAHSWKAKAFGLIGKKKIEPFFLETRWGIHTFGMKKSIDVIILNKNNVIVAVKEDLKPNHVFLWNPKYYRVLELPQAKIKELGLKLNQKIRITS